MRRMMKLVIERSVSKLLETVKKADIVEAVVNRISVSDQDIAEAVADTIDPTTIAREIDLKYPIRQELEEMDFSDDVSDAISSHLQDVDWDAWIDTHDIAQHIDPEDLAGYLNPDEVLEALSEGGSFGEKFRQMIDVAVQKRIDSPINEAADVPGVGKITLVDRVIDVAATKLLGICERTLELGDEADENTNNIEDVINGASSTVSVPAP